MVWCDFLPKSVFLLESNVRYCIVVIYKNFNTTAHQNDLEAVPFHVGEVFNSVDDCHCQSGFVMSC